MFCYTHDIKSTSTHGTGRMHEGKGGEGSRGEGREVGMCKYVCVCM